MAKTGVWFAPINRRKNHKLLILVNIQWSGREDSNLRLLRPEPVSGPYSTRQRLLNSIYFSRLVCNDAKQNATKCRNFWSRIGALEQNWSKRRRLLCHNWVDSFVSLRGDTYTVFHPRKFSVCCQSISNPLLKNGQRKFFVYQNERLKTGFQTGRSRPPSVSGAGCIGTPISFLLGWTRNCLSLPQPRALLQPRLLPLLLPLLGAVRVALESAINNIERFHNAEIGQPVDVVTLSSSNSR